MYPTGEQTSPKDVHVLANNFAVRSTLLGIDLSRHGLLRTLEVPASCVDGAKFRHESLDITSNLLKHVVSTTTPSVLFEVVVIYRDYELRGVELPQYPTNPPVCGMSQADRVKEASQHHTRFGVFREVCKVQESRLVLCADIWDRVGEYSVRTAEEAVTVEKVKGGFGENFSETSVVYSPRKSRTDLWQDFCATCRPGPSPWPEEPAFHNSFCY